jgi:hypothetical protein
VDVRLHVEVRFADSFMKVFVRLCFSGAAGEMDDVGGQLIAEAWSTYSTVSLTLEVSCHVIHSAVLWCVVTLVVRLVVLQISTVFNTFMPDLLFP